MSAGHLDEAVELCEKLLELPLVRTHLGYRDVHYSHADRGEILQLGYNFDVSGTMPPCVYAVWPEFSQMQLRVRLISERRDMRVLGSLLAYPEVFTLYRRLEIWDDSRQVWEGLPPVPDGIFH